MNIEKLAKMTGVSVGTVSKAFTGSKEISEKTHHVPDLKTEALNDEVLFLMYHLDLHIILDSVYS